MYGFWSSLALEFLARATLAKIHRALLADAKDNASEDLLFAFNSRTPQKSPKSIVASLVFRRCRAIYQEKSTKEDEDFCVAMAERRNSELHTGGVLSATLLNSAFLKC